MKIHRIANQTKKQRMYRQYFLNSINILLMVLMVTPIQGASIQRAPRPTTPAPAASVSAGQIALATEQSQKVLQRFTKAQQEQLLIQQAARATAAAAGNPATVANGLAEGGLVPDSGLAAPGVANPVTSWVNANTPVQSLVEGKPLVTIEQTGELATLNWTTFNIGADTTLNYDQKGNSGWIAVNKVAPAIAPSQILGKLTADGQVWVINQNGIVFGGNSQVNVRGLVASALPVNDALLYSGAPFQNAAAQFLFTNYAEPTEDAPVGAEPLREGVTPDLQDSQVIVQAGAQIITSVSADGNGGRVILVGPQVHNAGTISTPDGQTILAAGQQVAFTAHGLYLSADDTTLRGLEAFVGRIDATDPETGDYITTGKVENTGVITAPRGNIILTGAQISQGGVLESTFSVEKNGRIDLVAAFNNYGIAPVNGEPSYFLLPVGQNNAGAVSFGEGSLTQILPELSSDLTVAQTSLAQQSQINVLGYTIHAGKDSTLIVPGGGIYMVAAGRTIDDLGNERLAFQYNVITNTVSGQLSYEILLGRATSPTFTSLSPDSYLGVGGQIYIDAGAIVDVSGSIAIPVSVTKNIIAVELRGPELADSPLLRDGELRGETVYVDIRETGTYNGEAWVGTPIGDASGYVGLIQYTVGELNIDGGTISLVSGQSVIVQSGATLNVSGGWIDYAGGLVETTKLISNGVYYDISDATPDRLYSLAPSDSRVSGATFEDGYVQGGEAGSITIYASSVALDGTLLGNAVTGIRQVSAPPSGGKLSLYFRPNDSWATLGAVDPLVYGSGTTVTLRQQAATATQQALADFEFDEFGAPVDLAAERRENLYLTSDLFSTKGFNSLTIQNVWGDFNIAADTTIYGQPGGTLNVTAANVNVAGSISLPGGNVSFTTVSNLDFYLFSSAVLSFAFETIPTYTINAVQEDRGHFELGSESIIDVSGLVVNELPAVGSPYIIDGGSVTVSSYFMNLAAGSIIDVSGGVRVSGTGAISGGNAGSINIRATDPDRRLATNTDILRETFIGATLKGYGVNGGNGGAISIQVPAIQIGGTDGVTLEASKLATVNGLLYIDAEFFNQGGFETFTLDGFAAVDSNGYFTNNPGTAAVRLVSGTHINPQVRSYQAIRSTGSLEYELSPQLLPENYREAASINLTSSGFAANGSTLDSNILIEANSSITVNPTLEGAGTISIRTTRGSIGILGGLYAPGGSINVAAAYDIGAFNPLATIDLGTQSILSTAGKAVTYLDGLGNQVGVIYSGGSITISGNLVGEEGSVIDVSGTQGALDYYYTQVPGFTNNSGTQSARQQYTRVIVESDGGTITLSGDDALYLDSTLKAFAGGESALGGTLALSSDFNIASYERENLGEIDGPGDLILLTNVYIQQDGLVAQAFNSTETANALAGIGQRVVLTSTGAVDEPGGAHIAADTINAAGFNSVNIEGTVRYSGDVTIETPGSIQFATGGAIVSGDEFGTLTLRSTYVGLGRALRGVVTEVNDLPASVYQLASIATGSGNDFFIRTFSGSITPAKLVVDADHIDVGNLLAEGIGSVTLNSSGDVRGSGTLQSAGVITITAAQIYPTTDAVFTIAVINDPVTGETGLLRIQGTGSDAALPYSAGGILNLFAHTIEQGGVLRAPFGQINLGSLGSAGELGAAYATINGARFTVSGTPVDESQRFYFDPTETITILSGSITSVSGVDPKTGVALVLPYGTSVDGEAWLDPSRTDITSGGVTQKTVNVVGANVEVQGATATQSAAVIDVSGGGDLFAYQWVSGTGGTKDILSSTTSFAIVPGYNSSVAPVNGTQVTTTLSSGALSVSLVYQNSALKVGDQIYLEAGDGFAAGYYTLLPARYALLSGAFLVTPKEGIPSGTSAIQADGSSLVSGYQLNGLNKTRTLNPIYSLYEVASYSVVANRAEYNILTANSALTEGATSSNVAVPRLPVDGGQIVFNAVNSAILNGKVSVDSQQGQAGIVDIAAAVDILVADAQAATQAPDGVLVLDAAGLSQLGADSLLIGGRRSITTEGTLVTVLANNLTVDNADSPLTGSDIILVANETLTVTDDSQIIQNRQSSQPEGVLLIGDNDSTTVGSGNGVLLRVSSASSSQVIRRDVTPDTTGAISINVGAHTQLQAVKLILDSTGATNYDPTAGLQTNSLDLGSGRISLQLDNAGELQSNPGLVIPREVLAGLQESAESIEFTSYSSVDIYGTGTVGSYGNDGQKTIAQLSFDTAAIRGFNNDAGEVTFIARDVIFQNSQGGTPSTAVGSLGGDLIIDADTVEITGQQSNATPLIVSGYQNLNITAAEGLILSGAGGVTSQGDLHLNTPLITATSGSKQSVTADGDLVLSNTAAATASAAILARQGLGSSVTLTGATVTHSSAIELPSGRVTIRATEGDVNINGLIDVGGTAQVFFDQIQYTNGGAVTLTSDNQDVNILSSGTVNVAANTAAGDGGILTVNAASGNFNNTGTLLGHAGGSGELIGQGGSFQADLSSLPSTSAIDGRLNTAGFTQERSYRARTGNVAVDGLATAQSYILSADAGSVTVTGTINAQAQNGGQIYLVANENITLASGSNLNVAGQELDAAGKAGEIHLETRGSNSGLITIAAGSTIDLSINNGVGGKLYLRAPQNAAGNGFAVAPILGTVRNPSAIIGEGYRIYDTSAVGGVIDTQLAAIRSDSIRFATTNSASISGYLANGNSAILNVLHIQPGAEVINSAPVSEPTILTLSTSGTLSLPIGQTLTIGGTGSRTIRPNIGFTITDATTGTTTAYVAGSSVTVDAGDQVKISDDLATVASTISTSIATVTYSGGSGVSTLALPTGITITASGTTFTSVGSGNTISLRSTTVSATASTSSSFSTTGNSVIYLGFTNYLGATTSSAAFNFFRPSVTTTYSNATTGAIVTLTASGNTSYSVPIGTQLFFTGAGTKTIYGSGTFALPSGTYTLQSGSNSATSALINTSGAGDLILAADLNLYNYRYGTAADGTGAGEPGALTLRATNNILFRGSLSDGFGAAPAYSVTSNSVTTSGTTVPALWLANLLPIGSQSWTYRITSGADLSAADVRQVNSLESLPEGTGSVLVGIATVTNSLNIATTATNASTFSSGFLLQNYYQVIRTGTGDIDITAGRDVQLRNQFATIYTAGSQVAPIANFDLPQVNWDRAVYANASGTGGTFSAIIGNVAPSYTVSYSMGGGNVTVKAQNDIIRLALSTTGLLVDDSTGQLPTNWLYRRSYVDEEGNYATYPYQTLADLGSVGSASAPLLLVGRTDVASATWWVDYSNFFEGVGALGGGNVSLIAGRDVKNVDGVIPTNAMAPKGKAELSNLVEYGGGDLLVRAGRNISGGTYYVEKGTGTLQANEGIISNSARLGPLNYVSSQFVVGGSGGNEYDPSNPVNWLGTLLFVGKSQFNVEAGGDINIGGISNPFLFVQGINNSPWDRTYFSTYSDDSEVTIASLYGQVAFTDAKIYDVGGRSGVERPWTLLTLPATSVNGSSAFTIGGAALRQTTDLFTPFIPPNLKVVAFDGDVTIGKDLTLWPSPTGSVEVYAGNSLTGLGVSPQGAQLTVNSNVLYLADVDPDLAPRFANPLKRVPSYDTSSRIASATVYNVRNDFIYEQDIRYLNGFTALFVAPDSTVAHDTSLLHRNDNNPARIYTREGDIADLVFYSAKEARVIAGRDILNIEFYIQNTDSADISLVSAGRYFTPYSYDTPGYQAYAAAGYTGGVTTRFVRSGNVVIAGPGALEILAGSDIDLGLGVDGAVTVPSGDNGRGIFSVGSADNFAFASDLRGADIIVGAGVGVASGLSNGELNFDGFIAAYLDPATAGRYSEAFLPELGTILGMEGASAEQIWTSFSQLGQEQRNVNALELFYIVLREAGRGSSGLNELGGTQLGYDAITTLFPPTYAWDGDIRMSTRNIVTRAGGDINIFAPGGGLLVGFDVPTSASVLPGILTLNEGNINIFTRDDVLVGTSRIFTFEGGYINIWASEGDIDAGAGAKTLRSAPANRFVIDVRTGEAYLDLAGLATGSGIGVLSTREDVPPGDIDLAAPEGIIDAGDAGIRVTGNINLAALDVLNLDNIKVGGTQTGVTPTVAPDLSGLTTALGIKDPLADSRRDQDTNLSPDAASIISVEVIGYGGSSGEEESEEERLRRLKQKKNQELLEQQAENTISNETQPRTF